ncbi:MAG: transcription-repair coupling factor [Gemmatimonadetes bacterium]|nr:transcription-repair coupling factor [Gemmatimonadota bacterium]
MPDRAHPILQAVQSLPSMARLERTLPRGGERVSVGGSVGSAGPALVAALYQAHRNRIFVAVVPDPMAAARLQSDFDTLLGSDASHLYPQCETRFYSEDESDAGIEGLRVEAIEALLGGGARLFVTTPRALQERMPIPDRIALLRLELAADEEVGFSLLVEQLSSMGYERVPLVEEIGQFAVRGGLVDVFSLGLPDPVRIEFWGDRIVSIRPFEVGDQRSTSSLQRVHLLPASFRAGNAREGRTVRSLLEVLPSDAILVGIGSSAWEEDFQRHWAQARTIRSDREEGGERLPPPEEILLAPPAAAEAMRMLPILRITGEPGHELSLEAEPPPVIERKMERLVIFLREEAARAHRTLILCDNDGQVERLEDILLKEGGQLPGVQVGVGTVDGGFRIPSSPPLTVLTDHEIFRRRRRVRPGRRYRGAMALESLAQLAPGDYVVHMEHGIGRFRSLERIEVGSESLEVLAIEYADGETLRVPVYRLDLIERWVGQTEDSEPPAVHRIGGKRWKSLKRRTEQAIEQATRELLEIYAERELGMGYAFSPDTKWQTEMEAAFLYEDTPDQRQATKDVKRDMEAPRPMDRLICGDVGFGKTEVGIRAAFKAVQDGKQVAVLAPTTVLVEQHLRTFSERLADFPVRIESLSRFRTPREQKELLASLASGETDIVIGTHRLLSEDVRFRDLGLLIVDEEQRFGVKHKERLKRLRAAVDVLTLTATPIPRTLHLSLAGIRNLSLIRTPPRDRLAIATQAIHWTDDLLQDLMARELDRGGQVFFLHNRVETIYVVSERVTRLAPEARVGTAHGQMTAGALERVMGEFVRGELDVLVCSSIIENGLDVSNANTLIVDRADQFGLAQLYQIRGRVGRSDRRAYCYLIVPENITEEARERIRILERHTELGSGYQVALRDMEMRGAGNLLGASQSGFAHAVGLDTYLRLLEDAVRRLKQGSVQGERYPDPEVSLPGSAFIPDPYVSDSAQKLHLYRRLSKVADRSEVERLREELTDRYGPPPEEVERLLDAHLLRLLGRQLGIGRIFVKDREARITFRASATPRLTAMEAPFRDRQLRVEVRRMAPLSLALEQAGPEPVTRTLIRALGAVAAQQTTRDAA